MNTIYLFIILYTFAPLIDSCLRNGKCELVCDSDQVKGSWIYARIFDGCGVIRLFIQDLDYDEMLKWQDVPQFIDVVRVGSILCLFNLCLGRGDISV